MPHRSRPPASPSFPPRPPGAEPRRDSRVREALVARLILGLNLLVKPFVREFAEIISLPEWRCMAALASFPLSSGEDLAPRIGIDKMSVSRQLRALETRGYAFQEPDPRNRRRLQWQLTEGGWKIYDMIAPKALERDREFLSALTQGEAAQLRRLLDLAIDALKED